MKAVTNKILDLEIPNELKEKLHYLIEEDREHVHYVFYSKPNLNFEKPTITIITEGWTVKKLIDESWIKAGSSKYEVHVHLLDISNLLLHEDISSKIFLHLNCNTMQLVYIDYLCDNYEYHSYYKFECRKKYLKQTIRWFERTQAIYENIIENYIEMSYRNNNDVVVSLLLFQEFFKDLLFDFRTIFCPIPHSLEISNKEVLIYMLSHCSAFNAIKEAIPMDFFVKILEYKVEESSLIFNEESFSVLLKNVKLFKDALFVDFQDAYIKDYKKLMKQVEIFEIETEAIRNFKTEDDILKEKAKSLLKKCLNTKSVYLISQKSYNITSVHSDMKHETGTHYFLFVLAHFVSFDKIREVTKRITKETDGRVKVTIISQKATSWKVHVPLFHEFYEKYCKYNIWYGSSMNLDYDLFDLASPEKTKVHFWKNCSELINDSLFSFNSLSEGEIKEVHFILYRHALHHTLLAIIYSKLNMVPNIQSTSYLWEIVEWCYPQFYQENIITTVTKKLLFDHYDFEKSYPKEKKSTFDFSHEDLTATLNFCKTTYTFAKNKFSKIRISN